jgi:hypothetical protein
VYSSGDVIDMSNRPARRVVTVGRVPAFPGTRCNISPRAQLPAASD